MIDGVLNGCRQTVGGDHSTIVLIMAMTISNSTGVKPDDR